MMSTLSHQDVINQLQWRYAVKEFSIRKEISADDWSTLEQALILSPSSYGLQPWRFFVVADKGLRQQLYEVSNGQEKVKNSSHLLVFAAKKTITPEDIRRWVNRVQFVRKIPASDTEKFYENMLGDLVNGPRSTMVAAWAKQQTYLALGVFLTTAAMIGIDTCPMEGFDAKAYDRILNLDELGYTTAVIATAGYRSESDKTANLPKVRYERNELLEVL